MDLIDRFFGRNKGNMSQQELVNLGVCPNCWGKQEYEGKYKEYVKDSTKSALSGDPAAQKSFIQEFVEKHISGIRLKSQGDKSTCPICSRTYFKD